MSALAPFLIPCVLGFSISSFLLNNTKLTNQFFLKTTLALPVGLGIVSLLYFWSYLLNTSSGNLIGTRIAVLAAVLLALAGAARLWRKFCLATRDGIWHSLEQKVASFAVFLKRQKRLKILIFAISLLIFALNLFDYLRYFLANSVSDTFLHGGWDARYFWNLKASFYFRAPEEWKRMFDPALTWSHTDYPLLLPGSVAWGWNWLNNESPIVPILIEFFFALSTVGLVIWQLATYKSWWLAFLAASFLLNLEHFRFWSVAQYADIPFCFFITSSVLMLICSIQMKEAKLLLLSGFLAGLSAWTKNEGIAFVFWAAACTIFFIAPQIESARIQNKKASNHSSSISAVRRKLDPVIFFGLGVLIPFLTTLVLKLFLDSSGNEYIGQRNPVSDMIHKLFDLNRIQTFGAAHFAFTTSYSEWLGLWTLFALAVLTHLWCRLKRELLIAALFVLALELTYALILLVNPYDLLFQIKTSLSRLLLHSAALALIYVFEVFGSLNPFAAKSEMQGRHL